MIFFKSCVFMVFCCILLLTGVVLAKDAGNDEEAITIVTYYPVPHGDFFELGAGRIAVGDNYRNASEYCWSAGSCNQVIDSEADLVVEGNVGIGTVTPQAKLDVDGDLRIRDLKNCEVIYTDSSGNFKCGDVLQDDYIYKHWYPESGRDDEMGSWGWSQDVRPNRRECPSGYVVVGVTWYEGVPGNSDAGDNIGVKCRKINKL